MSPRLWSKAMRDQKRVEIDAGDAQRSVLMEKMSAGADTMLLRTGEGGARFDVVTCAFGMACRSMRKESFTALVESLRGGIPHHDLPPWRDLHQGAFARPAKSCDETRPVSGRKISPFRAQSRPYERGADRNASQDMARAIPGRSSVRVERARHPEKTVHQPVSEADPRRIVHSRIERISFLQDACDHDAVIRNAERSSRHKTPKKAPNRESLINSKAVVKLTSLAW